MAHTYSVLSLLAGRMPTDLSSFVFSSESMPLLARRSGTLSRRQLQPDCAVGYPVGLDTIQHQSLKPLPVDSMAHQTQRGW
jgi:hypothetical protein